MANAYRSRDKQSDALLKIIKDIIIKDIIIKDRVRIFKWGSCRIIQGIIIKNDNIKEDQNDTKI